MNPKIVRQKMAKMNRQRNVVKLKKTNKKMM